MYCTICGGKQEADSLFCVYCGQSLDEKTEAASAYPYRYAEQKKTCPKCGGAIAADDVFCRSCGARCPEVQTFKKPLCICCGKPLTSSAAFCSNCGAGYQLDEEGYIDLPQDRFCSCGARMFEDNRFCTECGNEVSSEIEYKKAVLLCTNCREPLRSLNKYCANCGTNWKEAVRPKTERSGLQCPVCGTSGMPFSRKVCWQCGVKFSQSPWLCRFCGKTIRYDLPNCPECQAKNIGNRLIPPEFCP